MVLLIFLVSPSLSAKADNTVTWPYFSYPPYVMLTGSGPSGIYWHIREIIWKALPEYKHKRMLAPFNRSFFTVRETGANYCFTGLLKRTDREQFLIYSIPISIGGTHVIVSRKGALASEMKNDAVSLKGLLDNKKLRMGYVSEFSHGKKLDAIIAPYRKSSQIYEVKKLDSAKRLFKLLKEGRIDFFLTNSVQAAYNIVHDHQDDIELTPVQEASKPFITYIACTRNAWGEEFIRKVNAVLAREIPKPGYLDMYKPWRIQQTVPGFNKAFNRLVLEPAKKYKP